MRPDDFLLPNKKTFTPGKLENEGIHNPATPHASRAGLILSLTEKLAMKGLENCEAPDTSCPPSTILPEHFKA
jgi:hypothetical protein